MPRYDYRCENGHITEALRPASVVQIDCPACLGLAQRQSIYVISQGSKTQPPMGQRPLRIGEYQEAAAEVGYQLTERNKHLEHPLSTPDYYGIAKKTALAKIAAGEAD